MCTRGVVHSDRGAVGLEVYSRAGGESITFCTCVAGTFTLCSLVLFDPIIWWRESYREVRLTLCSGVMSGAVASVFNSSVSSAMCCVGKRFGSVQCWGKSCAEPEILYARVSGT